MQAKPYVLFNLDSRVVILALCRRLSSPRFLDLPASQTAAQDRKIQASADAAGASGAVRSIAAEPIIGTRRNRWEEARFGGIQGIGFSLQLFLSYAQLEAIRLGLGERRNFSGTLLKRRFLCLGQRDTCPQRKTYDSLQSDVCLKRGQLNLDEILVIDSDPCVGAGQINRRRKTRIMLMMRQRGKLLRQFQVGLGVLNVPDGA